MKNTIIQFVIQNGWIRRSEDSEYQHFYKNNNIGIDVSDDYVVLIDGQGDYLHIPINDLTLYTLLGHMLHHRIIACDYRWADQPMKRPATSVKLDKLNDVLQE